MTAAPITADTEIRVELVTDPVHFGPTLDVRLYRRAPDDTSEWAWRGTVAGFRLPVALAPLLAAAIRQVADRGATQASTAGPPGLPR